MIASLSQALSERGYDTLTAVQEAVTDPALNDADLLVSAQTGSGKTVGFGLAIGHTLLGDADTLGPAAAPLALIVAPTRELAFQVTRELNWLYAKAEARVTSCVGGMDMRDERRALERGAHIVVGTPGRLVDHIKRGSLDMSGLRAIVLDEADEMLDLGFREDLEFMLGEAPVDRRTLMFSATVPPMIVTLAQHYQRDAVRVTTLSERSQHADITYQALRVAQQDAENAIINVLRYHEAQNAIVFANTRATVNRLTARFANRGFAVVALSGELSQAERTHALQAMRDGRARVCVATDVAARGIDLPNLELVIHAELPSNAEGLLHRSGRTGRAGRKGISALVVPPKAVNRAERLLRSARVTAEWTTAPDADEILRRDEERLLADPVWSQEISEVEASFAEKLTAQHAPEVIAAAYLRLYRERHSAPEELVSPDTRAPAKERTPFGPSTWFSLSVGRDDRAEARWLLPLLCRAGGLDKDHIGAIRVQQSETHVEVADAGVPGFLSSLGTGGELEKGVTARKMDGAPDAGSKPPAKRRETAPKPPRKPAALKPREADDRPGYQAATAPEARPEPTAPKAEPSVSEPAQRAAPAPTSGRDGGDDAKPREARKPAAARPPRDDAGKPAKRSYGERNADDRPAGKRYGEKSDGPRPAGGKSGGYKGAGSRPGTPERGERTARPERKEWAGRPERAERAERPAAPRADASDTSKRFVPPRQGAGGKPGGKPAGKPGARPGGKPGAKFGGKPGAKFGAKSGPGAGGKRPGGAQPPRRKP
ncbi:DEAD/DEAH box helicase [Citreimonas salinaria]|uniref:ATP-dependent RNA helicase DeaD n=1 Tax=Citreimonas salinaria TaxID=321339 RepID=A0A1H3KF37_9RHOB|nr:DEAD/DEAH box helicase [Citreimonas salinaria]SDY50639.1 ATP-dependent RNA helicase DeaD [Citreimonas salinaria]